MTSCPTTSEPRSMSTPTSGPPASESTTTSESSGTTTSATPEARPLAKFRSMLVSHPLDGTPSNEKTNLGGGAVPQYWVSQHFVTPQADSLPMCPPIPLIYTANHAAFSTAFLHGNEVNRHWDDQPITISPWNCLITPENHFLDAIGRILVDQTFTKSIKRGSIIRILGLDDTNVKYFATYSQLMDGRHAFVRLVAYDRRGFRCQAGHLFYGNRILVMPRHLNDVPFPLELRFHALHTTSTDGAEDTHHAIKNTAWKAMSQLEKNWWMSRRVQPSQRSA